MIPIQAPTPRTSTPARATAPVRGAQSPEGGPPASPTTVDGAPVADALVAAEERAEVTLDQKRLGFDQMLRERAELERESNALRDLAMEQAKRDDELLKKSISMI
jgi:hypothetical protein